ISGLLLEGRPNRGTPKPVGCVGLLHHGDSNHILVIASYTCSEENGHFQVLYKANGQQKLTIH
ncbi:hypothetical protein GOP47_0013832, partial [Adiantum capillus-veneris]